MVLSQTVYETAALRLKFSNYLVAPNGCIFSCTIPNAAAKLFFHPLEDLSL
jgi:hypothetical protein